MIKIDKLPLLLVVLCVDVFGQAKWQYKNESVSANDADTVYFAFRPVTGRYVQPDSASINPPDYVIYESERTLTVRKISGTTADSVIAYVKPLDRDGRLIQNDSLFVLGSSFAAPVMPNYYGDGRVYAKSLGGISVKKCNGVAVIIKVFDKTGGARRFEIALCE